MVLGDNNEPSQYYVIDTSSLLEVRRRVPNTDRPKVLRRMAALVTEGVLVFPEEVYDELHRHTRPEAPDPIFDWVKAERRRASRFGTQFGTLAIVMAHPQAKRVVDPLKTGVEEADPHILALALALRETADVVVVTEETKDRPDKLSMTTACGALRLVRLPLEGFLAETSIWTP